MPRIFVADSFTAEPFKGNPAAVCLMETPIIVSSAANAGSEERQQVRENERKMQLIAMEMNLSETAFVYVP